MGTQELYKIIRAYETLLKKTLNRPDIEIVVDWTLDEIEELESGESYETGEKTA